MAKETAGNKFEAIVDRIPSSNSPAEAARRIQNASRELSVARQELTDAHMRLNAFLTQGIIPDHLKQEGAQQVMGCEHGQRPD